MTGSGGAVTRTTRDASGRVRQLDHPDRGTTVFTNDGFGELVSSTDAFGRVMKIAYDGLGRATSRVDEDGAERLTTAWTWDTAAHGIGKLHVLDSPGGEKTYGYTERGKLETVTLRIDGERAALESRLDYDELGRVETITYPTPAGAAPFVVAHDHDAHGHVLAVRDSATRFAYWRLTDVDSAGRFREEAFGNGAITERDYYADRQRLKSVVTRSGAAAVQDLDYGYDARLGLTRRTDALQPQHRNERFRYDPLERLTCAYFSSVESATAPCALRWTSVALWQDLSSSAAHPALASAVEGPPPACSPRWGDRRRRAAHGGGTAAGVQPTVGGPPPACSPRWGDRRRRAVRGGGTAAGLQPTVGGPPPACSPRWGDRRCLAALRGRRAVRWSRRRDGDTPAGWPNPHFSPAGSRRAGASLQEPSSRLTGRR
ncbi:hypothetical protein ACMHYB_41660 [Sorangium sp. So ce1128]